MRKANAERIQIVLPPNKNSRPAGCRAGEESFLRLFRKQRGGQVAVAGVGQQNNDILACVLRALCQLDGGPDGSTGGDAHQHAFLVTDQTAGSESVVVLHGDDLVIDGGVQHVRHKAVLRLCVIQF